MRGTIRRILVRDSPTHEDVMKDMLEPGERREMDCDVSSTVVHRARWSAPFTDQLFAQKVSTARPAKSTRNGTQK